MKLILDSLLLIFAVLSATAKEPPAPVFNASVNGHTIAVIFEYGKLDPKIRKIEKREMTVPGEETRFQWLLQGKPILGTDNSDPMRFSEGTGAPEVISSISIVWDGKKQVVPQGLFDHIVHPHKDTHLNDGSGGLVFALDPRGTELVIDMGVGDGGGASGITWSFKSDGACKIIPTLVHGRSG